MKHTPGPWEIEITAGDPGLPISQGGGEKIYVATKEIRIAHIKRVSARKYGEAIGIPLPTVKANAALIAASPDLLTALENCLMSLEWLRDTGRLPQGYMDKIKSGQSVLHEAAAAIAKAEGR